MFTSVKQPELTDKKVANRISEHRLGRGSPGGEGALRHATGLATDELAAEFVHLILHLPHLSVEALPDAAELRVDHTVVAHLDRNIVLRHGDF